MAESESKDCPCSNITIMQLFHELKQRYPKIPDHIVSKVIEQNFHDKSACETILQRDSQYYLQSYPGALISGTVRDQNESLSKECSAPRISHRSVSKNENAEGSSQCNPSKQELQGTSALRVKNIRDGAGFKICGNTCVNEVNACSDKMNDKLSHSGCSKKGNVPLFPAANCPNYKLDYEKTDNQSPRNKSVDYEDAGKKTKSKRTEINSGESSSDQLFNSSSSSLETYAGNFTEEEVQKDRNKPSREIRTVIADKSPESGCDSGMKKNFSRSQSSSDLSSPKRNEETETETEARGWNAGIGGRKPAAVLGITSPLESPLAHNYQVIAANPSDRIDKCPTVVAVKCSMQPIPLDSGINPDQTRSFTSVNLYLRPPSSEPQPPIEIQSGQSLTYTTSSFNPKKGYQSQLQIRIDPGGSGTFSACRTYISTPQFRCSTSKSSNCTYHFPASHRCQNRHHLRELLQKQKERKDLLARELRREKEKLRCMKNEVRLMTAAIEQRPNPHILPELKAEILRLRTECERLTAAVDLYSDNQRNLPLGETNEEFYRNIYTGQRFQREGSWSCQLCTFRNHPLLTICEECEMPRLTLGTAVRDVTNRLSNVFSNNNNTSFCTDCIQKMIRNTCLETAQDRAKWKKLLEDYIRAQGHQHPRHL